MTAFNRGLDDEFVKALNKQYEKGKDGWWKQFVDDDDLFLAIRHNAVHVYYRGCRLIEVRWRKHEKEIVGRTHYKYLLRPEMTKEYVEVEDGQPSVSNASAYFADRLNATELKCSVDPYVEPEKDGVHKILMNNPYLLDVEIAISDGEKAPRIDFAALQKDEAGKTHIVFYEAKHFDNPELRSRDKPKVVEQISKYRDLLDHDPYRKSIAKSYCRVAKNLCALGGVRCRHQERHGLLKKTDRFIIEKEPGLVVFGFDKDQKCGSVWGKHRAKLEDLLRNRMPILRGNAADVEIPTQWTQ